MTDKIKSGDMVIVYHPTSKIVGNYLTKTLNRTPSKNHRKTIMGVDDEHIKYYRTKYENTKVEYRKRIGS